MTQSNIAKLLPEMALVQLGNCTNASKQRDDFFFDFDVNQGNDKFTMSPIFSTNYNYKTQNGAMLALAVATRDQLLRVGPCVFEHGGRDVLRDYTGGMQSLVKMIEQLQAGLIT